MKKILSSIELEEEKEQLTSILNNLNRLFGKGLLDFSMLSNYFNNQLKYNNLTHLINKDTEFKTENLHYKKGEFVEAFINLHRKEK